MDNKVRAEGAGYLMRMLQSNITIQRIVSILFALIDRVHISKKKGVCVELHKWSGVLLNDVTNSMSLLQNLSYNQLHLEGAKLISDMLSDNCYIKSIKLSGDQLLLSP